MKLYYSPGACSLAPHIILVELGLPASYEKVDLKTKRTETGRDYIEINPKGAVPALERDNGSVLTENAVVLQYLAERRPDAALAAPSDSDEHYRLLEWLNFVATELHKGFGPLFNPQTPDDYKRIARDNLAKRFDLLEKQFGQHEHLLGERFTIADAYAFVVLNWTRIHDIDMTRWPKIRAFMDRVRARPAVRQAMEAEGLPV